MFCGAHRSWFASTLQTICVSAHRVNHDSVPSHGQANVHTQLVTDKDNGLLEKQMDVIFDTGKICSLEGPLPLCTKCAPSLHSAAAIPVSLRPQTSDKHTEAESAAHRGVCKVPLASPLVELTCLGVLQTRLTLPNGATTCPGTPVSKQKEL